MPPTFLFLLYKIIKEQTISNRRKSQTALNSSNQPKLSNHPVIKVSSLCRSRLSGAGYLEHTVQRVNPFLKKITNLIAVLFFIHQQNSRPANAADLLKSNIAVKLFQPTQGTNLSAASSVAALVVAPYRPHKPKLSTTNPNFSKNLSTVKIKEPL
ncbi:hypothetical protein HGG76_23070 [Ochrobactrum tritici]|uniref:Uncharacterized protein n=1 Tax=Brucella tritici TaxID=94626 RepID=A0A7X6FS47_9HYPH|nr:hypothetical protein [Brucella tritici]